MKKPIFLALLFGIVVAGFGLNGPANAQNAQWNALFDRIYRLEARIKSMEGGAAPVRGQQPASSAQMRRLLNDIRQMRNQLLQMDNRLRRLERANGRQGVVVPQKLPRNRLKLPRQKIRKQAQQPQAGQLPFSTTNIEDYNVDDGLQPYATIGEPQPPTAPYQPQQPAVRRKAPAPTNWQKPVQALPPAGNPPVKVATVPPATSGVLRTTLDGAQTTQASAAQVLYNRASLNLRSRRFGSAESGFKSFLRKNPSHPLASDAQFMLGETYYVQKNYRLAAQNYLKGYRKYPSGKRAGDTLFKLGMSLGKLGQKSQSCGAFETVVSKYSRSGAAARAKKEMQRGKC